jgi:hypothetical protein
LASAGIGVTNDYLVIKIRAAFTGVKFARAEQDQISTIERLPITLQRRRACDQHE